MVLKEKNLNILLANHRRTYGSEKDELKYIINIDILFSTSTLITKTIPESQHAHAQLAFEHQQLVHSWHSPNARLFP